MPFNLTPFAVTLNGKTDDLVPWLPPTDCRLRPDLHAFEAGKFEEANNLKTGLEELQRATRKRREAGELPPHQPRWFKQVCIFSRSDFLVIADISQSSATRVGHGRRLLATH